MRLAVARGPRGQPICIQTLSRAPLNWSLSAKAPLAPMLNGSSLLTDSWAATVVLPRATPSTNTVSAVPARRHSTRCHLPSAMPTVLRAIRIPGRRRSTNTQLGRPPAPVDLQLPLAAACRVTLLDDVLARARLATLEEHV